MKSSLLLLLATSLLAADLHVAPGGSDVPASGSQAAPFASLAYAVGRTANGDRILLQRGGTYRVSAALSIPGGRNFDAWGSGALPEITASQPVTFTGTWASNAAVRTVASSQQVLGLWGGGAFQPQARHPNSGWLQTAAGTTLNAITSGDLPGPAGRWTGAQVRWHRWHWFYETRTITNDSGSGYLALSTNGVNPTDLIGIPSGFFISGSLAALDQPGEWAWNGGTLYCYPPAGSPAIEIATSTEGISYGGGTIRNLAFRRFQGTALTIHGSATVEDCVFEEIEDTAISTTWNSAPNTIRRCIFRDVRNNGVTTVENPSGTGGTVIERNLFHRIGMERGYGGSGTWHSNGIVFTVISNATARFNRMIDIGYSGVICGSAGNSVDRNVIVRALSTMNDGGGVYTNCNSTTITKNIVLDSIGDLIAAEPFLPLGQGIWPEFLGRYHDSVITGNTVAGCNGEGIFLPSNTDCTVSGNTCVDNLYSGLNLSTTDNNTAAQNHTIEDNILAAVVPGRRIAPRGNFADWWNTATPTTALHFWNGGALDYGAMRRTSIVVPPSGSDPIRGEGDGTPVYSSLAAWSAAKPSWAESSGTWRSGHAFLLFNDTEATIAMSPPAGTWTHLDGSAVGSTVSVASFASVVLVATSAPPANPPYLAASGIDWRSEVPTTTFLGGTPINQSPTVNAGPDGAVTLPTSANLDGTVSDDGLPTAPLATTWSKVSGPGTVTFSNAAAVDTSATFSVAGTYVLQLSASDGALSASDTVQITVAPVGAVNQAPSEKAGPEGCGIGSAFGLLIASWCMLRLYRKG